MLLESLSFCRKSLLLDWNNFISSQNSKVTREDEIDEKAFNGISGKAL
jgi:hypothetical protein